MTDQNAYPVSQEQAQASEVMALEGFLEHIEGYKVHAMTQPGDQADIDKRLISEAANLIDQQPNRDDPLFEVMVRAAEVGALGGSDTRAVEFAPLLGLLQRTSPDSPSLWATVDAMTADVNNRSVEGGKEYYSGLHSRKVHNLLPRLLGGELGGEDVLPTVAMVCFGATSSASETGLMPLLHNNLAAIMDASRANPPGPS